MKKASTHKEKKVTNHLDRFDDFEFEIPDLPKGFHSRKKHHQNSKVENYVVIKPSEHSKTIKKAPKIELKK